LERKIVVEIDGGQHAGSTADKVRCISEGGRIPRRALLEYRRVEECLIVAALAVMVIGFRMRREDQDGSGTGQHQRSIAFVWTVEWSASKFLLAISKRPNSKTRLSLADECPLRGQEHQTHCGDQKRGGLSLFDMARPGNDIGRAAASS
jgi:hypothetical protein